MYTVKLIKKNGFDCNWTTLFIGRQYKLISRLEVTNYAVDYIGNYPNVNDQDILELAWEQSEDTVDNLLEIISSDSSLEVMSKEYHKWLYCTLKEVYGNSSSDKLFKDIENIFSIFESHIDMYGFFRKVSDAFYYPLESKYTIQELVEDFLDAEKQLILNS